jgi:uncharacterized membrane protein
MLIDILKVLFISALPVAEIRGGLPLALHLGFSNLEALALGFIGNTAIVVPAILVLRKFKQYLVRVRVIRYLYYRMMRKVYIKRNLIRKYGKYALFLFVAIPLPFTGAWTASVAAAFFNFPLRAALAIIACGVLVSGLIILAASNVVIFGSRLW